MESDRGYLSPAELGPIDVASRIDAAPADATVRGMFLEELVEGAHAAGATDFRRRAYTSFGRYPMREYMQLIVEASTAASPSAPLREAMRALGRRTYPRFAATMIGSAIFSIAGRDFEKVAGLAGRAYGVSVSPGEVKATTLKPGHTRVQLRQIWPFPDAFQIGVWEGALMACHTEGEIRVKVLSESDVDFDIRWTKR